MLLPFLLPPPPPPSNVEDLDAGLRARGMMPFIADLEASQRVSTNGLTLFRQLSGGLAEEMAKQMQENRSLKEEAEKLRGIKEKLSAANAKVAEQNKLLEKLPSIDAERDSARISLETAQSEAERLRTLVVELAKLNEEAEIRFGKASASGFQKAVDLAGILAPDIDWSFFTGKHETRDRKICLGNQVAYNPVEQEEEEEGSPAAEGGQVGDA